MFRVSLVLIFVHLLFFHIYAFYDNVLTYMWCMKSFIIVVVPNTHKTTQKRIELKWMATYSFQSYTFIIIIKEETVWACLLKCILFYHFYMAFIRFWSFACLRILSEYHTDIKVRWKYIIERKNVWINCLNHKRKKDNYLRNSHPNINTANAYSCIYINKFSQEHIYRKHLIY